MAEQQPSGGGSAAQASLALADWAAARFGGPVSVVGTPTTASQGMDNAVHFVELRGDVLPDAWRGPLVLRVQPDVERYELAQREAQIQEWCTTVGYPAPAVLAMLPPGEVGACSAQVMPRVPGHPMIEELVPTIWRAPAMVARLADLQARLHREPTDGWVLPTSAPKLAERRLQPLPEWCAALRDPALDRAYERVEALVPVLDSGPLVVCHGDFHPLNVLVSGADSWVIDWTDGALGDRHGDVARTQLLFRVAAIAAESPVERAALRVLGPRLADKFLRDYDKRWLLDRDRLAQWEVVHLLHGWGQVLALHAGIIGRESERARVPEALATWLRQRLQRRLAETTRR